MGVIVTPTAGEWKIEGVSDAVRIYVGQGRGKIILARLCPPQLPELETWANGQLMRAAPTMLDTLKWLDQIGGLGTTVHERITAAIAATTKKGATGS